MQLLKIGLVVPVLACGVALAACAKSAPPPKTVNASSIPAAEVAPPPGPEWEMTYTPSDDDAAKTHEQPATAVHPKKAAEGKVVR